MGSLSLSGTIVNGLFFGIVAVLPPREAIQSAFETPWAAVLPVVLVVVTTVMMIRGAARLRRGDPRGPRGLSWSWRIGAAGTWLLLVLTWVWVVPVEAKAGFSLFMLPMAIAAAWGGRSAAGRLKAAPEGRP